jgi:hypothetical protein
LTTAPAPDRSNGTTTKVSGVGLYIDRIQTLGAPVCLVHALVPALVMRFSVANATQATRSSAGPAGPSAARASAASSTRTVRRTSTSSTVPE